MAGKFFGEELDSDYFEEEVPFPVTKGYQQKSIVPFNNYPAAPFSKPVISGGKIEITDYFFHVPCKKRKITWVNFHSDRDSRRMSELDVYAKMLQILKKHELL